MAGFPGMQGWLEEELGVEVSQEAAQSMVSAMEAVVTAVVEQAAGPESAITASDVAAALGSGVLGALHTSVYEQPQFVENVLRQERESRLEALSCPPCDPPFDKKARLWGLRIGEAEVRAGGSLDLVLSSTS